MNQVYHRLIHDRGLAREEIYPFFSMEAISVLFP